MKLSRPNADCCLHFRLFITISIAEKSPDFEWKKFAADVEEGCKDVSRLVEFLKGTYEKLKEAGVDQHFSKAFDALKEKATEVEAQDLQKEQEKLKALEDQRLAQRIVPESSEGLTKSLQLYFAFIITQSKLYRCQDKKETS